MASENEESRGAGGRGEDAKDDKGKDENGKGHDQDDGGEHGKDAGKPRSKKPLIIVAVVVVALAIVGFFFWFARRNEVSTDDAYTDGNVVNMVPKVSGYVIQLGVNDNTP